MKISDIMVSDHEQLDEVEEDVSKKFTIGGHINQLS